MSDGQFPSANPAAPQSPISAGNESSFEAALGAVLNKYMNKGNPQFRARLLNQMVQLARHGNFAETFIRTTPEGTDMVNFARLWEYVLVQADRGTRGYVAKNSRAEFELTRKDFEDCVEFMVARLQAASKRHKLDLSGTNFISRVAQRYGIAEKVRKGPAQTPPQQPKAVAAQPAAAPQPVAAVPAPAMVSEEPAAKPKRVAKPKVEMPDVDAL
ncbi:MAG: hypothetical protein INF43_00335 [Alphaproteobacteria bacterium]|nr:hypothetical protein [Alphaproteobacteria bacterium]